MKRTVKLLNIDILNISTEELLQSFDEGVLITPNVDHLVKLQKDAELYQIYQQTDWVICDSKIVQLGLKFLGKPVKEVIPGSSFFPAYYNFHRNNEAVNIFLMGAAGGIAEKAAAKINQKVGREMVIGHHSPTYGFEKNEQECLDIVDKINQSGATVLVVGVGAPKQEKWIFKYKHLMPGVKVFMALGATIDFEAGTLKRAPVLMQKLSLEWLYRMWKEPGRLWKRYMVDDLPFFTLIFKEKRGVYKNPFGN